MWFHDWCKTVDEEIDLNEQQFTLLQMMYTSDINAKTATDMLGVSLEELQKIVNELIQCKMLRSSGKDEIELTEKAVKFMEEQIKKSLEEQ